MSTVQKADGLKPGVENPATSAETVTVACRMPNGIRLRIFNPVETYENVMGGGSRKVTSYVRHEQEYVLNGNRLPFGVMPEFEIAGGAQGYALTAGIPKDFWDKWFEQNRESSLVKNGIVFAHVKHSMVQGQAKDQASAKTGNGKAQFASGLEPLDVDKPMRGIEKAKT